MTFANVFVICVFGTHKILLFVQAGLLVSLFLWNVIVNDRQLFSPCMGLTHYNVSYMLSGGRKNSNNIMKVIILSGM